MNHRERSMAVLHYQPYDKLPLVHFGFWTETLEKWWKEGHLTEEEARGWYDGGAMDKVITQKLGFDFNWYSCFHSATGLFPAFETKVLEELEDGTQKVLNSEGRGILLSREGFIHWELSFGSMIAFGIIYNIYKAIF